MVMALILAITRLKGEWTSGKGEPFDWIGAAVFMPSLLMIIYGATEITQMESAPWIVLAGLLGMILFFRLQWTATFPILDIRLLINNLAFTFSNLATFLNYASATSFPETRLVLEATDRYAARTFLRFWSSSLPSSPTTTRMQWLLLRLCHSVD